MNQQHFERCTIIACHIDCCVDVFEHCSQVRRWVKLNYYYLEYRECFAVWWINIGEDIPWKTLLCALLTIQVDEFVQFCRKGKPLDQNTNTKYIFFFIWKILILIFEQYSNIIYSDEHTEYARTKYIYIFQTKYTELHCL